MNKSSLLALLLYTTISNVGLAQVVNSTAFYKMKAAHSGLFLSVRSNSMKSNTQMIQSNTLAGACEDGQAFRFVKIGDHYKIEVRNKSGKCLAIDSTLKGANIIINDYDGSDNQLWKLIKTNNVYAIQNKSTALTLTVSDANTNSGAAIVAWDSMNSPNQQWELAPAEEEKPYWENLGNIINTTRTEMMPAISPDGRVMYFTRGNRVRGYVSNGDIYMATLQENGQWGEVKKVDALSNERHNGVVGFFPGGNSLLLFGDYSGGNAFFSITKKTTTGWTKPIPVKFRTPKLTQNIWSGAIGSDGKTILIELNTTGYLDESDLFVTFMDANGNWSEVRNLGEVINIPGSWDGTPYLAPDMKTLYFNSSRNNTGGTEIFMAKRLDDTWTNWSDPVKIEVSMYEDAVIQYYLVPGDGTHAYFVSGTKTFGEGDILRMKLKEEERPEPFLILSGRTLDSKTGNPISASIVFEDLDTNQKKGVLTSDPVTGTYQIALPKGINYGVYASAKGYYSITQQIEIKNLVNYSEKNQDLLLAPLEIGETLALNNLFFDKGKDALLPTSYPELERLVKLLNDNPAMQIELHGHTDNVGGVKENQLLSENRSRKVADYLIQYGINATRVKSKGFGASKPIAPNDKEENRRKNRRVEFVIMSK
jgi:outer membrane protein OmpA-like peptidoglycan-associated protein